MEKTVQAVYENGVLHPLEPLPLQERQQVTLTVHDTIGPSSDSSLLVSPEEWSAAARDDIDIEDVRRALSTIQGSLSDTIIEERRER
jgi:predicted DNA-binding antitoxin AbrB/MazE fold protein